MSGDLAKVYTRRSAFKAICAAIGRYWDDSPHNLFLGCWLLSMTDATPTIEYRQEDEIRDHEFVYSVAHWMAFANAAYGWQSQFAFSPTKSVRSVTRGFLDTAKGNIYSLYVTCGISEKDVIVASWESKLGNAHDQIFMPAYFLAVDYKTKSIVFTIRGTMSIYDVLTDVTAEYCKFFDGEAHSGMAQAALILRNECEELFLEQLRANPGFKFVIVGHSLGAGTATLLAMLMKDKYPDLPLLCFAFAPPPVVTSNLADKASSYITSIVHEDDIVPRACRGSVLDLVSNIKSIQQRSDGNLFSAATKHFFQLMFDTDEVAVDYAMMERESRASQNSYSEEEKEDRITREGIDEAVKEKEEAEKDFEADETLRHVLQEKELSTSLSRNSSKLSLVGNVYHLVKVDGTYKMFRSSNGNFSDIKLCAHMFSDHLPPEYIAALRVVEHDLNEANLLKTEDERRKSLKSSITLFTMLKYGVITITICCAIGLVVRKERSIAGGAFSGGFWRQLVPKFRSLALDILGNLYHDLTWTIRLRLLY